VFKRILLSIDGTEQSLRAAAIGIALAARGEQQTIGLEVLDPVSTVVLAADTLVHDSSSHTSRAVRRAQEDLAEVAAMARDAQVAFEDRHVFDRRPYTAIVAAAKCAGCDLIVTGAGEYARSHHAQLSREISLLINSTDIPVLVCP